MDAAMQAILSGWTDVLGGPDWSRIKEIDRNGDNRGLKPRRTLVAVTQPSQTTSGGDFFISRYDSPFTSGGNEVFNNMIGGTRAGIIAPPIAIFLFDYDHLDPHVDPAKGTSCARVRITETLEVTEGA
jgi:hypothetical protein